MAKISRYSFPTLTLREFLEQFKDFYIEFRVSDPDDGFNNDFEDLQEFEESGFAYLLDISVGDLAYITMYPHGVKPTIEIYYRRDTDILEYRETIKELEESQ